jgi:NTE family protein
MITRALVLGGGGPVGVAWESGLVAGFARAGVDLSRADYVLGTSAGAIVGARLRRLADPAALADPLLAAPEAAPAPAGPPPAPDVVRGLGLMGEAQAGRRNPAEARREVGRIALSADTPSPEAFRETIGRALALGDPGAWPDRPFACTAVDAEDGGFQLWDAGSGLDLLSAVASSCAVPGVFPPIPAHGRRYMDGGLRSTTNADLAAGHDVVVVVAVRLPGRPELGGPQLDEEVEALKAADATVVVVTPDEAAVAAMGPNLLDPGRNAPAARAGVAQAAAQAAVLKDIWSRG